MPALSDYLAQKYLTASNTRDGDPSDARPTKKRKKNKHGVGAEATGSTLLIADDDDGLLLSTPGGRFGNGDDEDNVPAMYEMKVRSAEFRKSKKSTWQTVDGGDARGTEDDADVLLRQTMASDAQVKAERDVEDAPAVVETEGGLDGLSNTGPRMETGVRAGLQTAADTARLVAAQEAREAAEAEAEARRRRRKKSSRTGPGGEEDDNDKPHEHEETIYRDATGRRIDLSLRRQEARKAEQERLAAEKKARDSALGEVQLRHRQERKQELDDAQFMGIGRSVDDEEMNSQLKREMRWDDPMARYMASKRSQAQNDGDGDGDNKGDDGGRGVSGRRKGTQAITTKEYAGASAPNRYGIKAGWRWDGVDRGNGFENQWFQARGKKARNANLEYMWQMDE